MQNPPGRELRAVAFYVHDCMSDPGLFGGLELTDPPMAIATKLFHTWIVLCAELIAEVWADKSWPESSAKALTEWAITEMLPSTPKVLSPKGHVIGKLSTSLFLIAFSLAEDIERAATGLQAVAAALGMNRQDYLMAITEVIDAV